MRTVKIIFLLVKIFNNEQLAIPKKIKYNKHIYEYEKEIYDWAYYKDNKVKYLMSDVFNSIDNVSDILNYEVEIIEDILKEDKKIDKLFNRCVYANNNKCIEDIILQVNKLIDKENGE